MSKPLVIVGNGETARLAYEYFTHDSLYEVVCFSVHQKYINNKKQFNLPVLPLEELNLFYPPDSGVYIFVAISYVQLNRLRTYFYQLLKKQGYKFATYISKNAFIWKDAVIGDNTFIMEQNTIQSNVVIGDNCVLWSGNQISHGSRIGNNVFFSINCSISGFCEIKSNCFLGANSIISDGVTIEEDCFLGAGSIILKNTQKRQVYFSKTSKLSEADSYRFCKVIDKTK